MKAFRLAIAAMLLLLVASTFSCMFVAADGSPTDGALAVEAVKLPATPKIVSAVPGPTTVILKWTATPSTGAIVDPTITGYKIYWGTLPHPSTTYVSVGKVITYTLTGLSPNRDYFIRMVSVSPAGTSAWSNEVHLKTLNTLVDHYDISIGTSQTAGVGFSGTLTAKDAMGGTVTSAANAVTMSFLTPAAPGAPEAASANFYTSGTYATTTTTYTLSAGVATIYVKDTRAESFNIRATDVNGKIGTSSLVTVQHNQAVSVALTPNPGEVNAGSTISFTATATDAYSNSWDVTSTTSFEINTHAGGSWTANAYTAYTAGVWTVNGTDSVSHIKATATLTVHPGPLDHFTMTGYPQSMVAGVSFPDPVEVKAWDAYGNLKTDYTGTVYWYSSDDYPAQLPAPYTFVLGDGGVKSFPGSAFILFTTGDQTITVSNEPEDDAPGFAWIYATSRSIHVNPGPISYFTLTGISDPSIAGATSTITVSAFDEYDNAKTDYLGTVTFSTSDPSIFAFVPVDYTFQASDNGVRSFIGGVRLATTGYRTVTVSDTVMTSATGSQTVLVKPGPLDHFTVAGIPSPIVAGDRASVTVTAYDFYGNIKTDYTGTIHFTTSDANATGATCLPNDYTFTVPLTAPGAAELIPVDNGVHTFTNGVKLTDAGFQSVTVWDVTDQTKTGSQSRILVQPAALDHFYVEGITDPQTAGSRSSVMVTAHDAYENVKTNYVGTIHFSSNDQNRTFETCLPNDYTFTVSPAAPGTSEPTYDNGVHTFRNGVLLTTSGELWVKVTDISSEKWGAQTDITVLPAALDHFSVVGIADPVHAGTATTPVVTAYDRFNNVKTDYLGSITFSSSDVKASTILPPLYTFKVADAGVHSFTDNVTLTTTGEQSVTVTDTVTSKTGQQIQITVLPGPLGYFTVTQITDPVVAGVRATAIVTAYDVYDNIKTDYTGTIHFTTSDGNVTHDTCLPNDYTFTVTPLAAPGGRAYDDGIHYFIDGVKLTQTGEQSVTVTDTVGGQTGSQQDITVLPAALDHFHVFGITDPIVAGERSSVTVEAYDEFENLKTDYTGTIHFGTSDENRTSETCLPWDYTFTVTPAAPGETEPSYDNGVHTFVNGVKLTETGNVKVEVTDIVGDQHGEQIVTVLPAALDHFHVAEITSPIVAGERSSVIVGASDRYQNLKTDYKGTIHFTSSDLNVTGDTCLPWDYTFTTDESWAAPGTISADNGIHLFILGVKLTDAGFQSVTVTDTVGGQTGSQTDIEVLPAALTHYDIEIASPKAAGVGFTGAVTARDMYENVQDATDLTLNVPRTGDAKMYTDGNFNVEYYFCVLTNGEGTLFIRDTKAETIIVTVQDELVPMHIGTCTVVIRPGPLDHFHVYGITDPEDAGTVSSVTVEAYDAYENLNTSYRGTIHFSSTDTKLSTILPVDYEFTSDVVYSAPGAAVSDNGRHTFLNGVKLTTTGEQTVTVTDTVLLKTGEQTAITVNPAALSYFTVTQIADPVVAGVRATAVVTAYDRFDNVKTDYRGNVFFTSSDVKGTTILPPEYRFRAADSGIHTFVNNITLTTTGDQWVRVAAVANPEKYGEQTGITVLPAAIHHFTVAGITSPVMAGVRTSPTVSAYDVYNNLNTTYVGTIHFTSSDVNATGATCLPWDYTFILADAGVKTFNDGVVLTTTGLQSVTVTDIVTLATGSQVRILVTPADLGSFSVTGITDPVVAGTPTSPMVIAYDIYRNIKTDYTGTITFTSSDANPLTVLPPAYHFKVADSGVHLFSGNVTLTTVGEQSVTVTDGLISGSQSDITVTPAALHHFTVAGITDPVDAGLWTSPTVTAYDAYGNVKTNYLGTIHFTSTDVKASTRLPSNYAFQAADAGVFTFTEGVKLTTTGEQSVTVWDTSDHTKTGAQTGITVNPDVLHHFTVAGITDPQVAGTVSSVTVTAYDRYNNVKTDYSGTIKFSSSDVGASTILPADYNFRLADNGVKTFTNGVTLTTAGDQWVRVTSAVSGKTGEQTGITVTAAALDHYHVVAASPQQAGIDFTAAVSARDVYDNLVDVSRTITSARTGSAVLYDPTYTTPYYLCVLTNGVGTIYARDNVVETVKISVYDDDVPPHMGSQLIDIGPGPVDHYEITFITPSAPGAPSETAGVGFPMLVEAYDQFGNKVTGAANNVTLYSSGSGKFCDSLYADPQNPRAVAALVGGQTTIYVNDTVAEIITITVVDGQGRHGMTLVTISAAAVSYYTVELYSPRAPSSSDERMAGHGFQCLVKAYDKYGNFVDWATNNVTLRSTLHGFFTDATYNDPQNPREVRALVAGQVVIYVNDTVAETITITVTDEFGHTGSLQVTIVAAHVDHYEITFPAQIAPGLPAYIATAGVGFPALVTAYDMYGNIVTWATNNITLYSSGSGKFCDSLYTDPQNPRAVAALVGGQTTIYVNDTVAEMITLTIADGEGKTGFISVDVLAGPVEYYVIGGEVRNAPTAYPEQIAGIGFSLTVTAYDQYGNPCLAATNNVTLKSTLHGFFTDSIYADPQNPRAVNALVAGETTIYVRDTVAETILITVIDGEGHTGSLSVTIIPANLSYFTVTVGGAPMSKVAGALWSTPGNDVVVVAYDQFGNVATGYTGSPTWSASCPGTLPEPQAFLAGRATFLGNGFALNTAAVTQTLTITNATGEHGHSTARITITAASFNHYNVAVAGQPVTKVAGVLWGIGTPVTVTMVDVYDNTIIGNTGFWTISWSTSSTIGNTLPASGSKWFTAGVSVALGTNFALGSAGQQTITVTGGGKTGTSEAGMITIVAAAPATYEIETEGSAPMAAPNQNAGVVTPYIVKAYDAYGNFASTANNDITVSSGGSAVFNSTLTAQDGTNPRTYTLSAGMVTIYVYDQVAESITISVSDSGSGHGSGGVVVDPLGIDHYDVDISSPQKAGLGFSGTVTAKDKYDNPVTWDSVTQVLMTREGSSLFYTDGTYGVLQPSSTYTLSAGVATVFIKDNVVELETYTAQDSSLNVGTCHVTIGPGEVDYYVISTAAIAPGSSTTYEAGVVWAFEVRAYDVFGNFVPSAQNNITMWSTGSLVFNTTAIAEDGAMPQGYWLVDGVVTIFVYDTVAETVTIRAADEHGHDGELPVIISAADPDHYRIDRTFDAPGRPPISQMAGEVTEYLVAAFDRFGNFVDWAANNFTMWTTSTALFNSSAVALDGTMPRNYWLSGGEASIFVYATVDEYILVRAADEYGADGTTEIRVYPADPAYYEFEAELTAPGAADASQVAGVVTAYVVEAYDRFGNFVDWADNSITLTSTGTGVFNSTAVALDGTMPRDYTLVRGQVTIYLYATATGDITLTATDANGKSGTYVVAITPAALDHFHVVISGASLTFAAGTSMSGHSVAVTARDRFDNLDTNFAGSQAFTWTTSSTPAAGSNTLPSGSRDFVNGAFSFGGVAFKLVQTGSQTITFKSNDKTGTSNAVTITPGALDHFGIVIGAGGPYTCTVNVAWPSGVNDNVVVTAYDVYNNTKTNYVGSPEWSCTAAATLPTAVAFVAGTQTFVGSGFTMKAIGTCRITITDVPTGKAGTSELITVNGDLLSIGLEYVGETSVVAGQHLASGVTVTAYDGLGNVMTSYAGTVRFSTTDPTKHLPSDFTFTAGVEGDNGVKTFDASLFSFFHVSSQDLTVTDIAYAPATDTITFTVTPAALDHFGIAIGSAPITKGAGVAWTTTANDVVVTAYDAYDNVATHYTGSPVWTSSSAGTLPSPHVFSSGRYTFPGTGFALTEAGYQTITITNETGESGTSAAEAILITAGAINHFNIAISGEPITMAAGEIWTGVVVTATAVDSHDNTILDFAGSKPVVWLSSSTGDLPDWTNYEFTSGSHAFPGEDFCLNSAGEEWISMLSGDIQGYSAVGAITITPAETATYIIDPVGSGAPGATSASQPAGVVTAYTVTAYDLYGNLNYSATDDVIMTATGSVVFNSTAAAADGTSSRLYHVTSGVATIYVYDAVAQAMTIYAYDLGMGGGMLDLTVVPGPTHHYLIFLAETIQRPHIGFSFTVTAKDKCGNTVTTDSTTQVSLSTEGGHLDYYTSATDEVLQPGSAYTLSSGVCTVYARSNTDWEGLDTIHAVDSSLRSGSCDVAISSTLFVSVHLVKSLPVNVASDGVSGAFIACDVASGARWE